VAKDAGFLPIQESQRLINAAPKEQHPDKNQDAADR
jgi:hypothetical protein